MIELFIKTIKNNKKFQKEIKTNYWIKSFFEVL